MAAVGGGEAGACVSVHKNSMSLCTGKRPPRVHMWTCMHKRAQIQGIFFFLSEIM